MFWYQKVSEDTSNLVECIMYFEKELEDAREETSCVGNIERLSSQLPGNVEHRFSQLQEIESILEYFNIELRKKKSEKYRSFLETYNRQLSTQDIKFYIDGEKEIVDLSHLVNQVALLRNKWLGVLKGLESKQFQINNIVKLRCAGLEDAEISPRSNA